MDKKVFHMSISLQGDDIELETAEKNIHLSDLVTLYCTLTMKFIECMQESQFVLGLSDIEKLLQFGQKAAFEQKNPATDGNR